MFPKGWKKQVRSAVLQHVISLTRYAAILRGVGRLTAQTSGFDYRHIWIEQTT